MITQDQSGMQETFDAAMRASQPCEADWYCEKHSMGEGDTLEACQCCSAFGSAREFEGEIKREREKEKDSRGWGTRDGSALRLAAGSVRRPGHSSGRRKSKGKCTGLFTIRE